MRNSATKWFSGLLAFYYSDLRIYVEKFIENKIRNVIFIACVLLKIIAANESLIKRKQPSSAIIHLYAITVNCLICGMRNPFCMFSNKHQLTQ